MRISIAGYLNTKQRALSMTRRDRSTGFWLSHDEDEGYNNREDESQNPK
jgi:hypothetical protein